MTTITFLTRRNTIECEVDAMGLRVIPDQVIRLGGSGALRAFGPSLTYFQRLLLLSPLAYWRLNEAAGTSGAGSVLDASGNSRTGTPTAVTFGGTGIGDGLTSASFDGATSYINVYTAALNAGFSGAAGTMCFWAKVGSSAAWTDGATRVAFKIHADNNNSVKIYKSATNNRLVFDYIAGATVTTFNVNSVSFTTWMHLAMTWSKANDRVIIYLNGAPVETKTGLGTFVGALNSASCFIGATLATPVQVWSGSLAHAALFSTELTAGQIAALANP